MPKSRMDVPKRKCAQALNHLAGAVLDINEVYEMFDQSTQRMIEAKVEDPTINNDADIERYKAYRSRIREIMMYIVVPREEIVKLIGELWELDEETIKVYLG